MSMLPREKKTAKKKKKLMHIKGDKVRYNDWPLLSYLASALNQYIYGPS